MRATVQIGTVLLAVLAGLPVRAADAPGETARVRLIAGETSEKAYLPRLRAIRELEKGQPLADAERAALTAFLRSAEVSDGLPEMERAALKNDVAERFLRLPETRGGFARDLLDMQSDPAQSPTWRAYCVQFLGLAYAGTRAPDLRKEVRERLYALADSPDPETCGAALIALAALKDNPEIDAPRAASRALAAAKDASETDGLRLTALQAAADLGSAGAAPLARAWLAGEKSANLRAVAIAVLGKCGAPSDRARIEPFLGNPDPRLSGAARTALGPSGAGKRKE
jgi:hypothetical protein